MKPFTYTQMLLVSLPFGESDFLTNSETILEGTKSKPKLDTLNKHVIYEEICYVCSLQVDLFMNTDQRHKVVFKCFSEMCLNACANG